MRLFTGVIEPWKWSNLPLLKIKETPINKIYLTFQIDLHEVDIIIKLKDYKKHLILIIIFAIPTWQDSLGMEVFENGC